MGALLAASEQRRQRLLRQGGFALVEMLAVLAVLAVIAGGTIVVFGASRSRAQDRACEADKQVLQTAVESYRASTGYFPSNQGILVSVFLEEPSSMWSYDPPVDLLLGEPSYSPIGQCE